MKTIMNATVKKAAFGMLLSGALVFTGCEDMLNPVAISQLPNEQAITSVGDLDANAFGMFDLAQSGNVLGGNDVAYAEFMADDASVQEIQLSSFGTLEIYNQRTSIQLNPLREWVL